MSNTWDQIDYDLQRKLIEINRRYERGELTYREWIDERIKAGATDGPGSPVNSSKP
tara:strand:+ start:938 stop:1105 length:168 start_codon:yes stop_codon:yes gene_type:complete